MNKLFVRTLAFCRKELSSSARQPLKVLGLVLGPFIIMAIFAAGYTGKSHYQTALVVPQQEGVSTNLADYQSFSKDTFQIVDVTYDKQSAISNLKDGKLDAVIVVPPNAMQQIYDGQSAEFPVYYRQLNPVEANYIEYSTYVYASEFDKVVLREAITASKPQSDQLKTYTSQMNQSTDRLQTSMRNNDQIGARIELERMKALTQVAKQSTASLIVPGNSPDNKSNESNLIGRNVVQSAVGRINDRLSAIDQRLNTIDQGMQSGDLNSQNQQNNLAQLKQDNNNLANDANKLASIPPAVIVSPVLAKAQDLVSTPASFVNFYSPAVVILLLQHIGITLSALSIVRDRMLGAIEIFRVAPINPTEILIGKFLSYTILLMIVSSLLLIAMKVFLGVPFIGNIWLAGLVLLTSTFASIGLGFLVAGLSKTETQAVQWSMLLILASIFFTGFIVPMIQFDPIIRYVSYALPMTFGASNLQNVMLDNFTPSLFYLLMPVGLGLLYFLVGRFLYKRNFSIS
ncbi:MAG TPA: ABC transporter permease [Chloroflexia bacterium]|nr:ABC transporter permease [Chloroflexia bacterium]